MLGYIFIILGAYTTYAFWSHSLVWSLITGLVTVFAIVTQYMVVVKNKDSITSKDNKIVVSNMVASFVILVLFILSFFIK